jgi:hypothetical protein
MATAWRVRLCRLSSAMRIVWRCAIMVASQASRSAPASSSVRLAKTEQRKASEWPACDTGAGNVSGAGREGRKEAGGRHLVLGEHEGLRPRGGTGKVGDSVGPLVLDAQSIWCGDEEAEKGWRR